jgi:hypothetical protein
MAENERSTKSHELTRTETDGVIRDRHSLSSLGMVEGRPIHVLVSVAISRISRVGLNELTGVSGISHFGIAMAQKYDCVGEV